MATPVPTPNTQAVRPKPQNFNAAKSYPLRLAERLLPTSKEAKYTNTSIQVDPSIKFGLTANSATITSSPSDPSLVSLNITHRGQPKPSVYRGSLSDESPDSNRYTLSFDPASQALILDHIDASISFSAFDSTNNTNSPSGSRAPSAHSDSGSIGSADESNPFDWRHQFRKHNSSSPDGGSALALSDRESPGPVSVPTSMPRGARGRGHARKASTPPGSAPRSIASSPGGGSDFELEFERETQQRAPARRGKRSPSVESEAERGRNDGDGDDDDDDGLGFEIEMDEKPERGRSKALSAVFGGGGQMRSLASVASSRSRSAQPPERKSRVRVERDDGFEIELDDAPSPEEHEHEHEHEHENERSDYDVSEMEMGSPVHYDREGRKGRGDDTPGAMETLVVEQEPDPVQEPEGEEEDGEQDDDDIMAAAFEDAFDEEAEDGDEEQGVAAAGDGYESEVSEEE